ncbi:DUF455 family protein [Paenibacillus aurantius]|uniref:DUF455 family protein n=1 Tax=Paenibacillus aurantius TaxID=2918900 RepID=A0AA96LGZ4_9BACL|nr:DUF455 family protein [Paenibacillus aurantius]WNQ13914.1 DUF455 family protein [Paenibacillus aurantius]
MARKIEVDVTDYSFLEEDSAYKGSLLRPIDTARLLQPCFWLEFELSRMTIGWVPGVPDWDVKGELVRMGYLHTEHMKLLRDRIHELPGPDIGEHASPPAGIRDACQRISCAPTFAEFATGYHHLVSKLNRRYEEFMESFDPVLDAPTLDRIRHILVDRDRLLGWAVPFTMFAGIDDPEERDAYREWTRYVNDVWTALEKSVPGSVPDWPAPPAREPAGPIPLQAAHDPRYPLVDLTKYKSAMFDPQSPTYDSVKHMVFINASEMSAAESLCYLYYGVQGMPADFYMDVARHTWDEIRHSQMGVRRLKQWGYRTEDFAWHPPTIPTPETMQQVFPEFYSSLTMVMEPCSFIKKRKSITAFMEHGDPLSSIQSEYDIADERLHVGFGQKWGAKLYEHTGDFVTAGKVAETVKRSHLVKMGYTQEQIDQVLKSFPEFCGFATMDLNYAKY